MIFGLLSADVNAQSNYIPELSDSCYHGIVDTCYTPVVATNIDSLKWYIFKLENKIYVLNDKFERYREQNEVDKLIVQTAADHIALGSSMLLSSILLGAAGVALWNLEEASHSYGTGYTVMFVAAGMAGVGCYQLWTGSIKLGWVGRGYKVVEK